MRAEAELRHEGKSFAFMFLLLAWLSATGILWPLAALPGIDGSVGFSKWAMLACLLGGVVGLIVFFIVQFKELWEMGKLYWPKG